MTVMIRQEIDEYMTVFECSIVEASPGKNRQEFY